MDYAADSRIGAVSIGGHRCLRVGGLLAGVDYALVEFVEGDRECLSVVGNGEGFHKSKSANL